ncbi:hypothetical protein [Mycobacterium tuberculosis]|uniref:hypothetical protein n=1 Tax=Mycobacterium tuberculosis TaxID=1773 RepID=UPI001115397C|nr:hypothetical protein [Mycobacterium tuberculosis]
MSEQPRKLRRCTIKEEYVSLTGDAVSAAILNQMIFWQEITNKSDQDVSRDITAYEKIGLDYPHWDIQSPFTLHQNT